MLREAVPTVSRLAVLWDATIGAVQFHATEMAARSARVGLQSLPIRRPEDVNETFQLAVREEAQAMVILSSPLIFRERKHIADLALKSRLPTISLFIRSLASADLWPTARISPRFSGKLRAMSQRAH